MNTFHEGDVYPVDVSANSQSSSSPLPDTTVLSTASPHTRSAEFTRSLLADEEFTASNFCIYYSQYDPISLQYMLDFFRNVAQSMPSRSPSPATDNDAVASEHAPGSAQHMLQDRAGIIVLREDLDYYVIPPRKDIAQTEMLEVKRAAGKSLLQQGGIFSGLRKSEEAGSTEQHLIEMLTAG